MQEQVEPNCLHGLSGVYKGNHQIWGGDVWQQLHLGAEPARAWAGTLREAGGGEGKADSAAQAPRCRNEHLLLDQVVRSLTGEIFMLLREKGICLEPVCWQSTFKHIFKRNGID